MQIGKITTLKSRDSINRALFFILVSLLAYSGMACNVARKSYQESQRKAQEASLELLLSQLRDVIKQYELVNGHPPKTLNDVVTSGYINEIPSDPITGKADWVVVMSKCPQPADNCTEGVKDLHSASKEKSTRGNLYSEW
jgi:general secretion pathway protein G